MIDKKCLSLLRNIYPVPLFNNEHEYQTILKFMEQIQLAENQLIFEAGKAWSGLYFIMEGQVRFVFEISGELVVYNQLGAYQHFGTLASENLIEFSVYSAAPLTILLYIPKLHFQQFFKTHPEIEKVVWESETKNAIKDFLIKRPDFSYVPTKHLQKLVEGLKTKKLRANEILIRQGDDAQEAYLVEKGRFNVQVDERPNEVLSTLMPGDLVGEIALVKNVKRTTNVIAQTEASVFVLSRQAFLRLFKEQAKLNEWVNQLVQARIGITYINPKEKSKDYKTWLKDRLGIFPVVLQQQPQDSAAACLAMVCRYYGKPVDLECMRILTTAKQMVETSYEPTLSDLSQAAERIGLMSLPVLSSYEHLMGTCLPVIVSWGVMGWAVVYQISENKVSMVDPAFGAQNVNKDVFVKSWSSVALYLKPNEGFFGRL